MTHTVGIHICFARSPFARIDMLEISSHTVVGMLYPFGRHGVALQFGFGNDCFMTCALETEEDAVFHIIGKG